MKTQNKVLIFYALAVLASMSIGCKEYNLEGDADAGSGGSRITMAGNTPKIKPLPVVLEDEWNLAGDYIPGDHTQHMQGIAYSPADPSRIYMGQDVSNVWVSTNFSGSWSTLKCQGLKSNFVMSIEADPVDANRLIAAVNCRSDYSAINENYQGIYISTNGGVDWNEANGGHRSKLSAVRSSTKLLAYAPTSKNSTMATRWYAAFGEGGASDTDHGFLTSINGGADWTEVRKLPASVFGRNICGIKVNKTNANQVFLYGDTGLVKITNATSPTGAIYRISGGTGLNPLPTGPIKGSLYQSNNGDTLIVAVVKKGVYKSTDGGTNWSSILQWDDINYCYVNEVNSKKIIATPIANSHQIKISDNGGATGSWWSPVTADVKYREGYPVEAWVNKLGGQFAHVLFNPSNGNIFMHSKSKNYISTDGGHKWNPADDYYNGSSHSSINEDQMFDPGNAKRFCYFMVDRGPVVTTEKGKWFVRFNQPDSAKQTCYGGAVQAGTQVILATVGMNGVGALLRSTDNGGSWSIIQSALKNRWVVAFSLQNKNICYQWRERSDNSGASWHPMNDMPTGAVLCGVSRVNGDVVYGMKLEGDGNTKKIFRSTNQGKDGSWNSSTPIINASWDLTVPGKSTQFVFKVHPTNDSLVYTSSANGEITKWNIVTGTHKDLTIIGAAPGVNYFHRFAIDPRDPDIMYAINQRSNTGEKFFRSTQGGKTGTWENLTNYLPQGSVNGLAVSPITGEVYISSENGSYVMLPPDNNSSNTAYSVVPYTMHHITAPY